MKEIKKCATCDEQIESPRDYCVRCQMEVNKRMDIAQEHIKSGIKYCDENKFLNAVMELSQAIDISPELDQAYYERGKIYLKNHKYDEALLDFTKAIELNPFFGEYFYHRALVYVQGGREYGIVEIPITTSIGNSKIAVPTAKFKAIEDLTKAIEIGSDDRNDPHFSYVFESCRIKAGLNYLLGTWGQDRTYSAINDYKQMKLLYPEKESECNKMILMLENRLSNWNDVDEEKQRLNAGDSILQFWKQDDAIHYTYDFFRTFLRGNK